MQRDAIVAWLRQNAKVSADLSRLIKLLCALRDGGRGEDEDEEDEGGKPVAILLVEEFCRLLLAPNKPRSSFLLRVLYSSMCRAKEAIGLRLADLNPWTCLAFVRGGKGDIDRYLFLDPATVAALLEWKKGMPSETRLFDFAWPTAVYPIFKRTCERLGIWQKYIEQFRISPHCIRYSGATHCHARGMPVWSTKAALGHSVLQMTAHYVHSTVELHRARYQQSMPRDDFDSRVLAPGEDGRYTSHDPQRDEVLQFILDSLPPSAELDEVIDLLCRRRFQLLGPAAHEFVSELGDEVPLDELFSGDRLPLVVSRHELSAFLAVLDNLMDRALFHLLYATGMTEDEALALHRLHLNADEQTIQLENRVVIADPATFDLLAALPAEDGPLFPLSDVTARLRRWAAVTGLAERYRGCERVLTPRLFRHAFGTHRYEDGMDILTLKSLLGHGHVATTGIYAQTALGRYRADYLRCHPLANGELQLPARNSPAPPKRPQHVD